MALLASALTLIAVVVVNASATTVRVGNLIITIEGGVSPAKLPRKVPAPITLSLAGSIEAADGAHVPALRTLALEFDKHGSIHTEGLPVCHVSQLQNVITARARKVCGDSLLGAGRVSAEIALPEQAPFDAGGPLLIFNGAPQGGKPVLIMHVHAHVPAPTTFVTTAVIDKMSGKYGTSALVRVPTIVGGQGSLTSFEATIHRTWTYRGHKKSLLLASCPTGRLFAHGTFDFADGARLSGDVAESCAGE